MNIILFDELKDDGETLNFLPLSDFRADHILNVLHLKQNDTFTCGIINRSKGSAKITCISSDCISFEYMPLSFLKSPPVTLIVSQVRPICMKRILRDAVMIGCGKIILMMADTAEKSYAESNLYTTGEYKKYLLDGAMQSGQCTLPEVVFAKGARDAIAEAMATSEICGYLNGQAVRNCAGVQDRASSENNTNLIVRAVRDCAGVQDVAVNGNGKRQSLILLDNKEAKISLSNAEITGNAVLAIGPERGWSDRERALFKEAGYQSMLLGERILRTETAVPVGLGVLLSRMGWI